MTDENILDIPSNSMLESMMSEYRNEEQSNLNNNNNDSPTNKETQIKSTINTLSINVNKTLNNETKPINNLIELPPIEDKQFIDWRSEENNSNINVGKKIHIDKSLGYFTQVPLNILHPLTFQSNTILKNISPIQHTEMNNDKVNEELIINCNDSNNMETLLPTSSSSLFLPTTSPITDSQSLSLSSSIEENDYNFECIVALNSISTSLESINNNNNDEQEKSIDDDDDKEDNYFNFNVKKSPNIIDLR
uniref:Ig-like domain-containing protein n=1 Tax=Parastrongyloides trichosuri TaxID=131310 RepID=A0A0N4Z2L4_PARTI